LRSIFWYFSTFYWFFNYLKWNCLARKGAQTAPIIMLHPWLWFSSKLTLPTWDPLHNIGIIFVGEVYSNLNWVVWITPTFSCIIFGCFSNQIIHYCYILLQLSVKPCVPLSIDYKLFLDSFKQYFVQSLIWFFKCAQCKNMMPLKVLLLWSLNHVLCPFCWQFYVKSGTYQLY